MPFFSGGSDPRTARTQMNTENQYGASFGDRGGGAWNALFPELVQNATNPEGLSAQEKATMNTASSQSLGGSVAGAVGQGSLMAERTHNPGGYGAALDASSKHAGETASKNALGVEEFSTNLAHQKQQAALAELGNLYGTNVKGLGEMMDAATKSLDIYEQAKEKQGSFMGDLTQIADLGEKAGDIGAGGLPF